MRAPRVAGIAVVVSGLAAAACGGEVGRSPTPGDAERVVEAATGGTARCPATIPRALGDRFTCTAQVGVDEVAVAVTVGRDGALAVASNGSIATEGGEGDAREGEEWLDARTVEDTISAGLRQAGGPEVRSVRCPEDRPMRAGDVFGCRVEVGAADREVAVRVTQTDGAGHLEWVRLAAVLDAASLAEFVEDRVGSIGIAATAQCGSAAFLVRSPGETVDCALTGVNAPSGVTLSVVNVEGTVEVVATR